MHDDLPVFGLHAIFVGIASMLASAWCGVVAHLDDAGWPGVVNLLAIRM